MSKLENTPKIRDSNTKKLIQYSPTLFSMETFQDSKIHTGIRNAVKTIKVKDNPSTPNKVKTLEETNQLDLDNIWNCVIVGSKKSNKTME